MHVEAEIHKPGLDLQPSRWNHHFIFMEEVHRSITHLLIVAQHHYEAGGRGLLHVDKGMWLEVVRESVVGGLANFPHVFVPAPEIATRIDFGVVHEAVRHLVEACDLRRGFVLSAEHYPGGGMSAYLIYGS